ncbi:inverse autotransporter beta domain-containing protein [Buttiauxella noackiae]|uniref:inverse autotransporter beta domain-containing protein n=1 Tax=Buttiauxella noackiae TaxID=82992 RepID=UPI0018E2E56D|nr:inverse autotransporter beta domain-containing protein [Buttiauxella noackiae]
MKNKTKAAVSNKTTELLRPSLRRFVWVNIAIQTLFPLASAFTPLMAVSAEKKITTNQDNVETRPYSLQKGETVKTVADREHLTVLQLKKLNQFRVFSKPFNQLSAGDELDIPVGIGKKNETSRSVTKQDKNEVTQWMAGNATGLASSLKHQRAEQYALSQARSQAGSASSSALQQWLSQFGTARVQLGVDNHFALSESAVDVLHPLYDNQQTMLFTQLGARHKDQRTTLNTGVGVRVFHDHWMYGVNTFLDNDITGHNRRVGIGGEAWTDNLKLSANSYFGMTDWHQSRDFSDYDERPANGFDIIANAYLPSLPQLGAKVKYEQYQGNDVALLSKDTRQKNPKALTLGLNYTPIPLVTLGSDYRKSGSHDDLQFNALFTYTLGQSWADQISPENVAFARSLAGSRTDLVERNNNIVLDYRKQDVVKLALPVEIRGQAGSQIPINTQITAKYGVDHIDWLAPELEAAGGKIIATGPQSWVVQLPAWKAVGNHYTVHATAWDKKGNASRTASSDVVVEGIGIDINRSSVVLSNNTTIADGKSKVVMTLTVRDAKGNLISGLAPTITLPLSFSPLTTAMRMAPTLGGRAWDLLTGTIVSSAMADMPAALANGGVTLSKVQETETAGVYTVTLTAGTQAGTVHITPHISGISFPSKNVELAPVSTQVSAGHITNVPVNPLADGHIVHVTVPVLDHSNKPLSNSTITMIIDGKEVKEKTDSNGNVIIDLPGQTTPGHHDFQIGLKGNPITETVGVDFIPVVGSAPVATQVAITGTPVVGEKLAGHYAFTDKDGDKEDAKKTTFAWYRDGNIISGATTATYVLTPADETHTIQFGVVPTSVTGTPATGPEVKSSATLAISTAQSQLAASVSAADSAFTITPASIAADGTATATLSFTAKNAQKQAVKGLTAVTFAETGVAGTTISHVTESNGVYTATLSGTTAGVAHVTVSVSGTDKTPAGTHDVTLSATPAQLAASVSAADSAFTITPATIAADGTATATLSFTAKNAQKQAVKGLTAVTFAETGVAGTTISHVTESNGVYTATLSGTTAGVAHVTVSVSGTDKTPAGTHDVTLSATPAQLAASVSAADSALNFSPFSTIAADGRETVTVTFTARNSAKAKVSGLTAVTFAVTGVADTTISRVTEMNGLNKGLYTATFSGTTAGVAHITVSVSGTDKTPAGTHDITLTKFSVPFAGGVMDFYMHANTNVLDMRTRIGGSFTQNIYTTVPGKSANTYDMASLNNGIHISFSLLDLPRTFKATGYPDVTIKLVNGALTVQ